jgi:hypothetical protein
MQAYQIIPSFSENLGRHGATLGLIAALFLANGTEVWAGKGNKPGGGGGDSAAPLCVTIEDLEGYHLGSDGLGDYCDSGSANGAVEITGDGALHMYINDRNVWIDATDYIELEPAFSANRLPQGLVPMALDTFLVAPDGTGNSVDLKVPGDYPIGLRIIFDVPETGTRWTVVVGDYPKTAKWPCAGGDPAWVMALDSNGDGVADFWTIEAAPITSACLLEAVPANKGGTKTENVHRAYINFPFSLIMWTK